MLQPQDIARLIEEFLGLLPATAGDTDAKAMSSLLVIGPAKGNRIIQILFAINYRFLGPNSRWAIRWSSWPWSQSFAGVLHNR